MRTKIGKTISALTLALFATGAFADEIDSLRADLKNKMQLLRTYKGHNLSQKGDVVELEGFYDSKGAFTRYEIERADGSIQAVSSVEMNSFIGDVKAAQIAQEQGVPYLLSIHPIDGVSHVYQDGSVVRPEPISTAENRLDDVVDLSSNDESVSAPNSSSTASTVCNIQDPFKQQPKLAANAKATKTKSLKALTTLTRPFAAVSSVMHKADRMVGSSSKDGAVYGVASYNDASAVSLGYAQTLLRNISAGLLADFNTEGLNSMAVKASYNPVKDVTVDAGIAGSKVGNHIASAVEANATYGLVKNNAYSVSPVAKFKHTNFSVDQSKDATFADSTYSMTQLGGGIQAKGKTKALGNDINLNASLHGYSTLSTSGANFDRHFDGTNNQYNGELSIGASTKLMDELTAAISFANEFGNSYGDSSVSLSFAYTLV